MANGDNFKITDDSQQDVHFPTSTSIDEEGLLPGIAEARSITGYIDLATQSLTHVSFHGIESQGALQNLHLKSHGSELEYALTQQNQTLTAMADGQTVFVAKIDNEGNYTFSLHNHIDRALPHNLVHQSLLHSSDDIGMAGWKSDSETAGGAIHQDILTQPGKPYQLTFYFQPESVTQTPVKEVHAYWDNQLLKAIYIDQTAEKGYTFSVEGNPQSDHTHLHFVGLGTEQLGTFIKEVSVISTAQHQLPLEFGYVAQQGEESIQGHFTVNVTTTPPIQLNNQVPFDVIFEQAVYQTIIVSDQNVQTDPLARIHLDSLFKNLAIQTENRFVEVVQLQENGEATNVYEVKISDKSQTLEPITVADIQLSFPGGNGGLSVFQKNIAIDEGSGLPRTDNEIIA